MSQPATGACQCGAVQFQISGPFDSFFLCHCSRCRKDTGSAFAANLFSLRATVTWLSGESKIRTYRKPGTRHEKSFCTECGSAVPRVDNSNKALVVPAGSLDGDLDTMPTAHICFASRASWEDGLENVPKMDGLPG